MQKVTQVVLAGEEGSVQVLREKITLSNVHVYPLTTIAFKKCALSEKDKDSLKQVSSYNYLFFTSVHAVNFFIDVLKEQHIDEVSARMPPVVAVGPVTAQACTDAGLSVVRVPSQFTVENMIKELPTLRNRKILFPRSTIAPESIVTLIRNRGAEVTTLPLYTTICRTDKLSEDDEFALKNADYIIFLSPSSVKSFINCVSNSKLKDVRRTMTALCVGPRTERAAHVLGFKSIITAKEFTTEGVIKTLQTLV